MRTSLLILALLVGCASAQPEPEPVEPASTREVAGSEASLDEARALELAEPVARAELVAVEAQRREQNPAVSLPWSDYEITVTASAEHFVVFYRYANPNPDFELWTGHGMHFTVYVDRGTGETRLVTPPR